MVADFRPIGVTSICKYARISVKTRRHRSMFRSSGMTRFAVIARSRAYSDRLLLARQTFETSSK